MLSAKELLHEMEACVLILKKMHSENRAYEMPYQLGKLGGYTILLQNILNLELCESDESSNG